MVKSTNSQNSDKYLSLTLSQFYFIIVHDFVNPEEIISACLNKNSSNCNCDKEMVDFYVKYKSLMKNRCIFCDFKTNQKLIICMFTKTHIYKNDAESTLKIKAMTDNTTFIGGFTGKKHSSYYLLGNSSHFNYNKKLNIQVREKKRSRSNDLLGFSLLKERKYSDEEFYDEKNEIVSINEESEIELNDICGRGRRDSDFFEVIEENNSSSMHNSYFQSNLNTKLFYLDPHYIQVRIILEY